MQLTDSQFNDLIDELLTKIEDAIDNSGADIDYDSAGGILTLTFENDSKVIINRQPANHELWLAAKSGGYHLAYDGEQWQTSSGENLHDLLNRVCNEQSGEAVELNISA